MATTYSPCPQCDKLNRVPIDGASGKIPVCGSCRQELKLDGAVSEVNGAGLQALIRKCPLPVVVDFWAPWCGPCRVFAPTFSKVAMDMAGEVVFVKLNTEEHQLAAGAYGIRSIPTLALFKNGIEKDRQSGAMTQDLFTRWVRSLAQG